MRLALMLIATVVALYAAACAALFFLQRSMIYFPQGRGGDAPTASLEHDGVRVLVTLRPLDGPRALLYFGGNAEDTAASLPALAAAFPGHAIYLMHYRGYGGSGGRPSEAALFADALRLFDHAHARHPQVAVIGRSLGSGVAIHLASRRPVARLALVTPYDSIARIAAAQFPAFPVRWLLRDRYESVRYAPAVTAPTLLLAAEHDDIIPSASTAALAAAFRPGAATQRTLAGTDHNTISLHPDYMPLLRGHLSH